MDICDFRIAPGRLTFDKMCRHLGKRAFSCIDLVGHVHRPRDDAFWQMDLVCVRNDRPEFAYNDYRQSLRVQIGRSTPRLARMVEQNQH